MYNRNIITIIFHTYFIWYVLVLCIHTLSYHVTNMFISLRIHNTQMKRTNERNIKKRGRNTKKKCLTIFYIYIFDHFASLQTFSRKNTHFRFFSSFDALHAYICHLSTPVHDPLQCPSLMIIKASFECF